MENKNTIILYTYKYVWQQFDGKLCIKYITDSVEAHSQFMKTLKDASSVKAAYREYINEVNFAYLNFTENFKTEKKAGDENEEI